MRRKRTPHPASRRSATFPSRGRLYVRPGFGWEEAAETRRRRRATLALTVIEIFLLVLVVLLASDMAGV